MLMLPLVLAAQQRGFRTPTASSGNAYIPGKYRALIIGNDEYTSEPWSKLKTAVKDATVLAHVLKERYGFEKDGVILKLNATRHDILSGLDRLKAESRPEDSVLIYYAGHGEYDADQEGYWVPVGAETTYDYIPSQEVLRRLRTIDARHKLIISDSCFSGNLITRGAQDRPPEGPLPPRYIMEKSKLNSAQGLASGGVEPVSDGGPKWDGHSIFAYHLLALLKANQQPYLSAAQLGLVLTERVANDVVTVTGSGQTPVFSRLVNQGDQGGEFILAANVEVPNALALFFSPKGEPAVRENLSATQRYIADRIAATLQSLQVEMAGPPRVLAEEQSIDQFTTDMLEEQANRALVVNLTAARVRAGTLVWEGYTRLAIRLEAFRIDGGRPVRIASYDLRPQSLPMRKWSTEQAVLAEHLRRNAEKALKLDPEQNWNALLASLKD